VKWPAERLVEWMLQPELRPARDRVLPVVSLYQSLASPLVVRAAGGIEGHESGKSLFQANRAAAERHAGTG
jgi:hypothetical protein